VSQAERIADLEPLAEVTLVPVAGLVAGSFRAGGVCTEQVDRLAALGGGWPPILVRASDSTVIDGAHRVAAARRLGMARLPAELFHGRADEAFIEFVRRNVTQGLALSLTDRKRAAERVLRDYPLWSDRRVAELCALSPKTVGRVRTEVLGCPSEDGPHSDGGLRQGRDNRLRPARPGSARARVIEALRSQPDASLRTLAVAAGVSPETVRLVRLDLSTASVAPEAPAEPEVEPSAQGAATWKEDGALASSEHGDDFLAWFERTLVEDTDLDRVPEVPMGRVYVIADEARRRSDTWLQFARKLEERPGRGR
jgi:ParB-like chromosome segregation protein Spo0J